MMSMKREIKNKLLDGGSIYCESNASFVSVRDYFSFQSCLFLSGIFPAISGLFYYRVLPADVIFFCQSREAFSVNPAFWPEQASLLSNPDSLFCTRRRSGADSSFPVLISVCSISLKCKDGSRNST